MMRIFCIRVTCMYTRALENAVENSIVKFLTLRREIAFRIKRGMQQTRAHASCEIPHIIHKWHLLHAEQPCDRTIMKIAAIPMCDSRDTQNTICISVRASVFFPVR